MKYRIPRTLAIGCIMLVLGCRTDALSPGPEHDESAASSMWLAPDDDLASSTSQAAACPPATTPGSSSYCSPACPCGEDLGDCDDDDECAAGLRCGKNLGADHGWDEDVDVCVPVCSPAGKSQWDVCSVECPCEHAIGDCDSDAECAPGLWCLLNAGPAYGYDDASLDVCVSGCPDAGAGAWNFCSSQCPCDQGQGDCDRDSDCAPGLDCVHDVGDQHGYGDPEVDVCLDPSAPPVCGNGVLEPGEACDDGNATGGDGCESDCTITPGCAPSSSTWSRGIGNAGSQWGDIEVAAAPCGAIVLTGYLAGTLDLGGGPLASAGSSDIFLAKLDSDGNHLWSRRFGTTAVEFPGALAVSSSGAIALAGFLGVADYGAGAPGARVAVVVFDGNGQYRWSRTSNGVSGTAVAFDAAGNTLLAGTCQGVIDLGGGPLDCSGDRQLFLAKFSSTGAHLWSRNYLGPSAEGARGSGIVGLAATASGDIIVGGSFGQLDLGGGRAPGGGYRSAFLARLDATGDQVWLRTIPQAETSTVDDLEIGPTGDIVAVGDFNTTPDFFGTGPRSAQGDDMFVVTFDINGNHVWTRQFTDAGAASDQAATAVAIAPDGTIFFTGWFAGAIDFGGGVLTGAGGWDILVAALSSTGAHVFSQVVGAPEFQHGFDVAADAAGNMIAAGMFKDTIDFGTGPLVSAGDYDMYLTKLAP
jgi:cysteine-rich repeat protein